MYNLHIEEDRIAVAKEIAKALRSVPGRDLDEEFGTMENTSGSKKSFSGDQGFIKSSARVTPIPDSPAYWISPSGKVLPVNGNHIDEVVDSPVSFGLNDEYVDETFQKYKEPKSFEGKARQEIMEGLIRRNWIRIRYIPRQDSYSIELNKLGKKVKDHLWAWAAGLLEDNPKRRYAGVKITEFAMDSYTYEFTLDELVKGAIYSKAELKVGVEESIVLINSVYDMLSIAPVAKSRSSIMSMATFRKNKSGLPVNIWVDDGMAYKAGGHSKRIKFQTDKGDRPVTFNFAAMTISSSPEVFGEHGLSSEEIRQLEDFVIRNKDTLEQLSDMEIDFEDFLKVVR